MDFVNLRALYGNQDHNSLDTIPLTLQQIYLLLLRALKIKHVLRANDVL